MLPRHKVMRKANATSWVAIFCLASLAMPLMAQQVPANPDAVRRAVNQPAAVKPTTGTNVAPAKQAASAGTAAPKAQAPKPVPPTTSPAQPASPASRPASTSGSSPAGPAGASVSAKPATGAPARPALGATPGPKPALGAVGVKPSAPPSKPSSVAAASSTAKGPRAKLVTAATPDVPTPVVARAIKPNAERENISRRDPFAPLLGRETSGGGSLQNFPAGKPGLLISSLRIDGIVSGPNGMIAIVSNAQERVYFLREGDRLYDGQVEHITMDGISFHQAGKDPFGNAVEREVAKRLNPTPGEQQ